jgi:hypothetical protein
MTKTENELANESCKKAGTILHKIRYSGVQIGGLARIQVWMSALGKRSGVE